MSWRPITAIGLALALAGAIAGPRIRTAIGAERKGQLSLGGADFTVAAWVRTEAGGVVLSLSSQEGVWYDAGKAFCIRGGRAAADLCNVGIWAGGTTVTDGKWHHIVWVYTHRERTLRFYVDGTLDGQATATALPDTEGHIIRIGAAAPGITPPNHFVGDIDEVSIHGRAVPPDEIGAISTGALSGESLAARWHLDGNGRDASGNGHDGIVSDAKVVPGKVSEGLRFDGSASVAVMDTFAPLVARMRLVSPGALRDAIAHAVERHGARYPRGQARLREAERWAGRYAEIVEGLGRRDDSAAQDAQKMIAFQREALLDDPSLNFDRILVVRRSMANLGLPANWEGNSSLPMRGYDNEVMVLENWKRTPTLDRLYAPSDGRFIGDVDLHFDARKALVSMPAMSGRWQVHELALSDPKGPTLRAVDLISEPDVDNYDACYLPDGGIMFSSTAPFVGVPCVTGSSHVANLYRTEAGGAIRRLTFEQDHDWCPTVMNDGRVMYLRWEYSDLPHFVSRILFSMNPDGTNQMALYGSNSYWPNSAFYARPVPGSSSRFMAIVSGHHDTRRMGELVLFDAAIGTHEAKGAIQRLPGRGKIIVPEILDGLVGHKWPKFLHPWPLDDERCLVAAQLSAGGRWGLYLADRFDNLTLIHEVPGSALLEPIPMRPRPVPPVIPDRTDPNDRSATVLLSDIHTGPGLAGVPRGSVKSLRLLSYQFAYHGVGGQVHRVGLDGPWDVRRIIGTVPVHSDGSAHFRVPANTPIALQPLDADGRALQLMRSWMTAMPGERLSCGGCHEPSGSPSPNRNTLAFRRPPDRIRPWYGPPRGFSFRREVQPVLNRHCTSCHGVGTKLDLTDRPYVRPSGTSSSYNTGTRFPPSYLALRSFVRGHTIESDMRLLTPAEFHASTTHLVRMLEKGHHGVRLDREGWDRINTWIDLNTPAHGTWGEIVGTDYVAHQRKRRMEMDRRYAGLDGDGENPVDGRPYHPSAPVALSAAAVTASPTVIFRGSAGASPPRGSVRFDLGSKVALEMVRVPGGLGGIRAARSRSAPVAKPFLIGKFEITNAQYRRFDPHHDSRLEGGDFLQFSVEERGYPVNGPSQPVCRVSRSQAEAFCRWLSSRTGKRFRLPTETQWEWACRAGTKTPMWYGSVAADFSAFANLADASLRHVDTFAPWDIPSGAIQPWRNAVASVNDRHRVSAPVGAYRPNGWGLHDMHGNVSEWTSSAYGGRETGLAVVRGGSWYDTPVLAQASYREAYPGWRRVFDVGFRVVCGTD